MDSSSALQLAIEATLGAGCLFGYRTERARAPAVAPNRPIEELRLVGEGEWVVLGSSEETSFKRISATPEIVADGFELEGSRGRVAVPSGAKVRIVAIDGARRAPIGAITRQGVVRPRFTFELKPGTVVYTDVSVPALHAYRAEPLAPDVSIVLGGALDAVRTTTNTTAFPGCWLIILIAGVATGVLATLGGATTLAWVCIGGAAALMLLGWLALPPRT